MTNKIYIHPKSNGQMQVEVILASISPDNVPLYTIRLRYPRVIHSEIMTHRVFSRNARSSRAVPVKTMLNEVRNTPYVPWHWGQNQSGMQAEEECNTTVSVLQQQYDSTFSKELISRSEAWLEAADTATNIAEAFMNAGYHKQNPNRLLEPFAYIDTLITATEWENFLWLRDHHAAEPHLQDLAQMVGLALNECKLIQLKPGEWHTPYITDEDREHALTLFDHINSVDEIQWLNAISAARCARISYKPFDGDASYEKEISRYQQLIESDRVHASPVEHQATPDNQVGEISYGEYEGYSGKTEFIWANSHLHGNLYGWIQNRKLIPGEAYDSSI